MKKNISDKALSAEKIHLQRCSKNQKKAKDRFLKSYKKSKLNGEPTNAAKAHKKWYDQGNLLPICVNDGCDKVVQAREWKNVSIKSECSRCYRNRRAGTSMPGITIHKKDYCENKDEHLGFKCPMKVAKKNWHLWEESLHLDHTDGKHENNAPSNVRTLCSPCHTRKSMQGDDYHSNKASGRKLE